MFIKYLAAALAVVLVFSFLGPIAWKLKEVSLSAVMAVGVVMMLIDLWQSLQKPDA
jgi:hypothetical protein